MKKTTTFIVNEDNVRRARKIVGNKKVSRLVDSLLEEWLIKQLNKSEGEKNAAS